ncbi:hypothetical protein WG922_03320 [Ramlibacter sp. AN1015]|uniref:hypothetical protein n=1 Tax=Ramlibacter sp. AN1015 TaxID=3133428 RepID=UPI0030BE93FF
MNSETSKTPFPTSSSMGSSSSAGGSAGGMGGSATGGSSAGSAGGQGSSSQSGSGGGDNPVKRVAQAAHEAVDRLEQTLGSSSERMMGMQEEYGTMAREQVRENPLAALGVAFVAGILFSKLFMR